MIAKKRPMTDVEIIQLAQSNVLFRYVTHRAGYILEQYTTGFDSCREYTGWVPLAEVTGHSLPSLEWRPMTKNVT